jgi:ElaB/YqjD/DUF883 family membrane-anchored ribosome-binding protein
MIYINEYTGEKYRDAAECEKAEKAYVEAKKKAEEKARLDKAKREAELRAKKEQVSKAYNNAVTATNEAVKALENYVDIVEKTGYQVKGAIDLSDLVNLLFEL